MVAKRGRTAIPARVKRSVLEEFSHRCAICGRERPHVHHIDGDRTNNNPLNLLPLCPNCHLIDQHNPTAPVDRLKMALFRRYRDPVILGRQFHPLFERMRFLVDVDSSVGERDLRGEASELIAFVNALQMGGYYGRRLGNLLVSPRVHVGWAGEARSETERKLTEDRAQYHAKLSANRDQAIGLLVELVRYQPWDPPHSMAPAPG